MDKPQRDNYANQKNPNAEVYWKNRGYQERPNYWEKAYGQPKPDQATLDNRSRQLNPSDELYYKSRGISRTNNTYSDLPDAQCGSEQEKSGSSGLGTLGYVAAGIGLMGLAYGAMKLFSSTEETEERNPRQSRRN